MKTSFDLMYKQILTVEEYEQGKELQKMLKEDDNTPINDYGKMVCIEVMKEIENDWFDRVLETKAIIQVNHGLNSYNYHGENTGFMDVIIETIGKTGFGFIEASMWLSDIWQIDGKTTMPSLCEYYRRKGEFEC